MSAPEPTAVERTIAEVIFANRHRATDCLTQAVVAAIRSLPPADIAELIGGEVEYDNDDSPVVAFLTASLEMRHV